jgi:DNA-binding response OmpR family regulator
MSQRLLLLDDDVNGRLVLAALLEDEGFEVIEAGSLGEGRALLGERAFDLVLLDVRLPDGFGTELVSLARARNPAAPIALLSGDITVPDWASLPCLTKGGSPGELLRSIRALVTGGSP